MMTENALINKAEMKFQDGDRLSDNFILVLYLSTVGGGVSVTFNPTKLPQLLRQLHLTNFNELEGTYVQIPLTRIGQECEGIRYIMAEEGEEWFKSENHTFFGCNFYEGYKLLEEQDRRNKND